MIHETAIVDDGAIIGKNIFVWHWTHISKGSEIGNNCNIGQNVFISSKAKIGNNVKIQNNVSIYDEVTIEDDVFCGPSVVFTNVYNPRARISRKKEYKKTLIKKGVTLGANSTIVCGITINNDAFIGAGALVNKDVKSFALIVGVPGKQIGWMSSYGERIDLPLTGEGYWTCPITETKYVLSKGELNVIDSDK